MLYSDDLMIHCTHSALFSILLQVLGYSRKKQQQGFEDIEFPGVLKKYIASGIPKG